MIRRRLAAAALLTSLAVLTACGSDPEPPSGDVVPEAVESWELAADQSKSAAEAGLPMLGREMLEVHYHSHIDLLVRGEKIPVPAYIGIDTPQKKISPLHTHDRTGIVHIESAEDIPFTLGQFFTEWGQPIGAKKVGPVTLAADERLRVYRDGREVSGDPAAIRFTKHGQFFIWVGSADDKPENIPASYAFPKGL